MINLIFSKYYTADLKPKKGCEIEHGNITVQVYRFWSPSKVVIAMSNQLEIDGIDAVMFNIRRLT